MSVASLKRPPEARTANARAEDIAIPLPGEWPLELGDKLVDEEVRLSRFGNPDAPQVVVLGGISAGRRVCGVDGWWREIVSAGIDLARYGVIGFDFSPVADVRVRITPHDQARIIGYALEQIGVPRLHAIVGASYGGMVGLAFAAIVPERIGHLCVISASNAPTAQALAWRGVQRRIVEFALAHEDPGAGLGLARQLAMITYRSAEEFETRFRPGVDASGRSELDRYLVARGEAYIDLMSPQRWLSLSEAIDRFYVDPGEIGIPVTLVAASSDQLVPTSAIEDLARRLPRLRRLHYVSSIYGHDAFLKETTRLSSILTQFLEGSERD